MQSRLANNSEYFSHINDLRIIQGRLNNIASEAPENLTLLALQEIYSYLFWMDIAIKKLPVGKTDFLVCIRKTIASKGKITDIQKAAINSWLENIEGVPQLK